MGSTLFDEIWIRRQNLLAWRWGMNDYEHSEEQRPDFKGRY